MGTPKSAAQSLLLYTSHALYTWMFWTGIFARCPNHYTTPTLVYATKRTTDHARKQGVAEDSDVLKHRIKEGLRDAAMFNDHLRRALASRFII